MFDTRINRNSYYNPTTSQFQKTLRSSLRLEILKLFSNANSKIDESSAQSRKYYRKTKMAGMTRDSASTLARVAFIPA